MKEHTLRPIVTGASVLAVKYKDGVMLAADTIASYGSLARYKDVARIAKVGEHTLVAAGGEYSDFQHMQDLLQEICMNDYVAEDRYSLGPREYASYMGRVHYNRRSKMDPLFNVSVVAGVKEGKQYLSYVDLYGTIFEEDCIATGFGSYLAMPLMRLQAKTDMPEAEARRVLLQGLEVLYCRDARSSNKVQFATCTDRGIVIEDPITIKNNWDFSMWAEKSTSLRMPVSSW
eukprot:Platyproteum_vivax@DN2661_c0_g1_i1.p1